MAITSAAASSAAAEAGVTASVGPALGATTVGPESREEVEALPLPPCLFFGEALSLGVSAVQALGAVVRHAVSTDSHARRHVASAATDAHVS
jgi:hypothetical protein